VSTNYVSAHTDAEQAPNRIKRGSHVYVGVGIHAAGDGPCFFYDGHSHPFLRLRDGTHPLAVGPVKPWPLIQARQIRPAMPVGCQKKLGPGRQIVSQDNPMRRQPTRRSGRDPGSRPYVHTTAKPCKPGRKHYPQSPCRLGAAFRRARLPQRAVQNCQFGVLRRLV